jgi:tetrachloro-p-hydroquinone reductive dehalogenase
VSDPAITLFHIGPSLYSQIVRLALAEKHIAYASRIVDIGLAMENYQPWYVRKNPGMVVPTLEVARVGAEPVIVTDAARIIVWIDEHLRGPALLPSDRDQRARVDEWLARQDGFRFREFSYGSATGLFGKIVARGVGKRIAVLERHQARIEDVRGWRATIADRQQVDALEVELTNLFGDLEVQLADQPFVVGDRYTLADVVWTVTVARAHMLRRTRLLGPQTKAWFERMRKRPSYAEADIWDRFRPSFLLGMIARSILPRRSG